MKKPLNILLIEDDPADVEITLNVLESNDPWIRVQVAGNGMKALSDLRGEEGHACYPDLILLELNLPGMHGREILTELKEDSGLQSIPVIIVTCSEEEEDIRFAYQKGASCFISKPRDKDQYSSVIKALKSFWLTCVTFPSK